VALAGTSHEERELKYSSNGVPELETLGGEALEPRVFTSVYYDTDDRRLTRVGITLRRRLERGNNVWQLKLPREGSRLELEQPGGPGGPPPELEAILQAVLGGEELREVATLKTNRSGRMIDGAEVTLDEVEVLEGVHVVERFTEIEAELVDASQGDLDRVDRLLRDAGAKPTDGSPKVWRVIATERAAKPAPEDPPLAHLRALLEAQHLELLRHDPGLRVDADPEDVHEARVAVRRLRTVLRAARPMLDEAWAGHLRAELGWLAESLGAVRDLDVLIAYFDREARTLDGTDALVGPRLTELLRERRLTAVEELRATLGTDRYRALIDEVESAAEAPHVADSEVSLERIATGEFRKLRKRARAVDRNTTDAALHKIRIRGKRARYAAELAEGVGGKPVRTFVEEAKRFQDVLGEHQDAVVAEATIRELTSRLPDDSSVIGAGRLVERQRLRRRKARAELAQTWRKLERAGRRAWT
jgi:CHAD domain-containing protein